MIIGIINWSINQSIKQSIDFLIDWLSHQLHLNNISCIGLSVPGSLHRVIDGLTVSWLFSPALTRIFHCPYRIAASPPLGWILCNSSCLGEFFPLDRVSHTLYPSTLRSLLALPPANAYNVGSQSVTCIRSRLTRPFDSKRGLWTKAAPRTPPVHVKTIIDNTRYFKKEIALWAQRLIENAFLMQDVGTLTFPQSSLDTTQREIRSHVLIKPCRWATIVRCEDDDRVAVQTFCH